MLIGGDHEVGSDIVDLGLGQDGGQRRGELVVGQAVDVVALQDPQTRERVEPEGFSEVGAQVPCVGREGRLLLDVDSMHACARWWQGEPGQANAPLRS